jgi:hypothetical protein
MAGLDLRGDDRQARSAVDFISAAAAACSTTASCSLSEAAAIHASTWLWCAL